MTAIAVRSLAAIMTALAILGFRGTPFAGPARGGPANPGHGPEWRLHSEGLTAVHPDSARLIGGVPEGQVA